MGKIGAGNHVLLEAPSSHLELDGIPFRSDLFVDNEWLRFTGGQIVTGPGGGGGGGGLPTKPFRVTPGGVVEYDTIQDAIDAASTDDLIYVPAPPSGTSSYNEQIVINKQVSLIAIGGKRCRITYATGPVVTVTSRCRLAGFLVEADSGTAIRFDDGSEYAIMDDVETGVVEINLNNGHLYFNFVSCYTLSVNSSLTSTILYAKFCHIDRVVGEDSPCALMLYNSYLGYYIGAITIHHSGGSPANFIPSERYINYNVPWRPIFDSFLVFRLGSNCWKPEPLEVLGRRFPLKPFTIGFNDIIEHDTIQQAVDFGGPVYIPPGSYNETVVINRNTALIGLVDGGVNIFHDSETPLTVNGCPAYIANLSITGYASPHVRLTGAADVRLINVKSGRLVMDEESYLECWFSDLFILESLGQTGSRIRANFSKIQSLALDGAEAELNSTYLGGMTGYGTVRHSGGSPGNFIYEGLTCDYYNLNIPYQPLAPSVLAWTDDRWRPLPLDELPGGGGGGGPHHTTHEDGGTDEINVGGLSGRLADYQKADQIGPWPVDISTPPQDGFVLGWSASQGRIVWLDPPQLSVSLPLTLAPEEASTQSESETITVALTESSVPG